MFKLEEIQKTISWTYDIQQKWWLVISGFESEEVLNFCKWVIFTDKKIDENLKILFDDFVKGNKKTKTIVIDIISSSQELKTTEELKNIDLLNEWVFIWDSNNDSWSFVLPNTKWIESIKKAIDTIKKKVKFSWKQISIYKFSSQRFRFDLNK